ncbi:MAG: ABC transporter permease [Bacteroidia bacterium]|nr:ABC transporter permease [Bacteroidia bacterium]NND25310.1 ABC transporter permease [Flavobacteriaceae bacterium]MBT8279610.1 ABC transporter permease [Bacteroidia bacterium]NNK59290.1 ABC transporter permease [Flavobacteriaceae bacterium]NNL34031.1 ABC transporter permease [Flavobacteriaceae bacterium]
MNHLGLVIKREYLTKVRNKAFIVMTILSPIIFMALFALVGYLSQINNSKERTIAVLDESGKLASVFENKENLTFVRLDDMTLDEAKQQVEDNGDYGLLHIENYPELSEIAKSIKFYSEDSPSLTLIASLENRLEKEMTDLRLQQNGVDIEKLRASETRIDIVQESFLGEKSSKIDNVVKLAFGGFAGYMLFMFIIIYGNMIMRSVIEEKTSRIIEVIISSVKPMQLLMGKIIGTSLAGITQFAIWVVLGGGLMLIVSAIFGIDMSEMQSQQEVMEQAVEASGGAFNMQTLMNAIFNLPLVNLMIAFILFFIGGYLLYSSLYAAIGAAVDNETDTQQFLMPILIPLILAVYVGVFTVIEDPHGTVSTVFSFIPFTSPVVMLMRIPFDVPLWQQLVSLVLLFATFMFTVWFAAKIYRVGILMYGKKPSYKELFKWLKY